MSLDEHRRFDELLGAYALGQLDDGERAELDAHLDRCPACRAELDQVYPVAALLPKTDPDRLEEPLAVPPAYLAERVYERVGQERRRESRRRPPSMGLAAAAAVLAVLFALSTFFLIEEPGQEVTLQPVAARTALPAGFQNLEATATLRAEDYSTQIELEASGLAPGQTYAVWLEREDGTRVPAGSFRAFDEGPETVYLSAAVTPEEAVGLVIGTPDGESVLRTDLLQGGDDADLVVPDLRSKTLEAAIEAAGPDFEVEAEEDDEQPGDVILDQDPDAGERARKGTTISVTLDSSRTSEVRDRADSDSANVEEATTEADPDPGDDAGPSDDVTFAAGTAQQPPPVGTGAGPRVLALNLPASGLGQLVPGASGPGGEPAPAVLPIGGFTSPDDGPARDAGEYDGAYPLGTLAPAAIPEIEALPGLPLLDGAPAPAFVPPPPPSTAPAPAAAPTPADAPPPDDAPAPGDEPGPIDGTGPDEGNGGGGDGFDDGPDRGGGGGGGGGDGGGGNGRDEVTVCHKPGTPAEQTLTVSEAAVDGHSSHGDTRGPCRGGGGGGGDGGGGRGGGGDGGGGRGGGGGGGDGGRGGGGGGGGNGNGNGGGCDADRCPGPGNGPRSGNRP